MAIQNDHLDDPDYIHWFKQPIWSVSQVIFLIQGIAPPQEDWTNAQLIKAFPTAKRVLQEIKEYDPDWGKDPGSWLHYLSNDITDSWVAIMSSLLPTSLAAILDEEPDYNRFIGAIICDEKLALGDLVKYALRIGRKNFVAEADDYQAVLLSAASRLDVADGDTKALERKIVSVKKFVDKYPRNPQPIDDECSKCGPSGLTIIRCWLPGSRRGALRSKRSLTLRIHWLARFTQTCSGSTTSFRISILIQTYLVKAVSTST